MILAYDIHDCVFRYMSNFLVLTNNVTSHDNLYEYLYPSYANGAQHPNVMNQDLAVAGADVHFYNNVVRHNYASEAIFLTLASGQSIYFFNNVFFDNENYVSGTAAANCIIVQARDSSGTQTMYFTQYDPLVRSDGWWLSDDNGLCSLPYLRLDGRRDESASRTLPDVSRGPSVRADFRKAIPAHACHLRSRHRQPGRHRRFFSITPATHLGEREPIRDIAKNLERWVHGIVARVFAQESLDELAATPTSR